MCCPPVPVLRRRWVCPSRTYAGGSGDPGSRNGRTSEAVETAQLNTRKHDCRTQTDCPRCRSTLITVLCPPECGTHLRFRTVSAPDPADTRRPPADASRTVIRYPGTPTNLTAEPPRTIMSAPGSGHPVQLDMQKLGASPTVAVGGPNTMTVPAIPANPSLLQACPAHGLGEHDTDACVARVLPASLSGASRHHTS
jgi:hypothetical protein